MAFFRNREGGNERRTRSWRKTGDTPRRRPKGLGLDGPGAAGPHFLERRATPAGPSSLQEGENKFSRRLVNPIARHIRATATEDDAGRHVTQCALDYETEDDGGDPGCRQQALDQEIEDIGDDGKGRGDKSSRRGGPEAACPRVGGIKR